MPDDIKRLKDRIDHRLDAYLCDMKEGYDDSITGFNEAWDIVRKAFAEALDQSNTRPPAEVTEDVVERVVDERLP